MTERVSIIVVDDHAVVREGLKMLLNNQSDLLIVGEASDGTTAVRLTAELKPNLAMVDIALRGLHGIATTQRIREANPSTRVLAFSVHEEPDFVKDMMEAGASGYVLKRSTPEELLQAVRTVAEGSVYIDRAVASGVVRAFPRTDSEREESPILSSREAEVLRYIASGHTNKEIAEMLLVSVKTVETYKARVMNKLNISRRADMVKYAIRRGWLADI